MIETQNIEFKQRWRDDFLAELCGFANAQGGTLYIGIDDKGNVVGIENAKQLLEKLPNLINQTMGMLASVNLLEDNGKHYLSVTVKASEQPISYRGKYYYRSGTTLQEINGNSLHDFLMRKIGTSWDSFSCEDATMDDIDPVAVEYFVKRAVMAGRMPEDAQADNIKTVLTNLDLLTKDGKLKNAAVLLFGKRPQRFFTNARFRIGRFMSDETDLIHHDNIEGNIIQMADKVMWKLRQDYLIANITYEGLQRVEHLEVPETALRELVHNAIVHRDYMGADTQMKVYNDRIWLWNEGELPEGFIVAKAAKEHFSKPRNKLIADVFYKAGFIESWGRGIGMAQKAFRNVKLKAPQIKNYMGGVLVVIPRNNRDEPLNSVDGTLKLTENQNNVLNFVRLMSQKHEPLNEPLNTNYIAIKLGMPYSTTKRITNFLERNNLIRRVGGKKAGYWEAQ